MMNRYFAFMLLLLMPLPLAGQVRWPTLYRATPSEEAGQAQAKSPHEGRQIRSLEFRGNQHFSSEIIRDFMLVKVGDPYDADKLDTDMDRLRVLLFGRAGYLKANLRLSEYEIEDTDRGLEIVVPVTEGVVYRLGEIKVEDATLFSPEEITQIVGLKSGETVDGHGFHGRLETLSKLYRDRGYFQFNVALIPDFKEAPDAEEGVVDITLALEEGETFQIDRIEFEGNSKTRDQALRRRLLIQEGDVYSESMLQESLSRLNSLGLFEKLTRADAALHINDNSGRLDITIRLKEKERQTDR